MGWDVVLQGIGEGLKGGLDAYSWQQDRNERRRQFDRNADMDQQTIDLRREQLKAELEEMARQVRKDEAADDAAARTAAERDAFIASLPPHLQQAARAEGLGIRGLGAEDFAPPKPKDRKIVPVKTTSGRAPVTQYHYEDELPGQSFPEYVKPDTPISRRDDPALPRGVREYLSGFAGRYNDRASAKAELDGVLQQLYQDHPDMDTNRVYQMFDRMFPARDEDALIDDVMSRAGGQAPRSGGTPVTAPTGAAMSTAPSRGATPVSRRGSGRASGAGPAGQVATPPTMQVGSVVQLRNGSRVRVRAIHPDGTFEFDPVQ